jgi:tryptophan synthase alpha chain
MTRITDAFGRMRSPAFIAFLVAGDPDYTTSLELARQVIRAGADILEFGMPFSDPVADGPTIQKADERALNAGMTPDKLFALVRELRKESDVPIVLLTYYNVVFRRGIRQFYRQARDAGIDGILIVDMPYEESDEAVEVAGTSGMDQIFLVSVTSTKKRVQQIISRAGGFLYLVSTTGVTGARGELEPGVFGLIRTVRHQSSLPLAVGFGISKPEHVQPLVSAGADAVIVGSAIVQIIEQYLNDTATMLAEVSRYVSCMKKATAGAITAAMRKSRSGG